MSGMIDDSEDDIIVWTQLTDSPSKLSEEEIKVVGNDEIMKDGGDREDVDLVVSEDDNVGNEDGNGENNLKAFKNVNLIV